MNEFDENFVPMTLFEIENLKHNLTFNTFVKLTANNKYKSVINSLISDWSQSITTNIVPCVLQTKLFCLTTCQ